jgi:hypothetical protein
MLPGILFRDEMKYKPQEVNELITAKRNYKLKVEEAENNANRKKGAAQEEFEMMLKKYKKV